MSKNKKKLVDPAVDDIVDVSPSGDVIQEQEAIMYLYTNEGNDAPAQSFLGMFYEGVLQNTLGIMRALNVETDKTELLLVGVNIDSNGSEVYPLARILTPEDLGRYKSPDGKGGWFDPNHKASDD